MVSVIIPVYNVEKYLEQCLLSVMNQSFQELEIILVDDGSKDRSPEICDEYARKDKRIKVIHKENGGLMAAWKDGVCVSKGEYIGFVDSDDWIDADMYENLYRAVQENDADIALCGWIREGKDIHENERMFIEGGKYSREDLEKNIFPHMISFGKMLDRYISPNRVTKLFKKELLENNFKYFDDGISIGEDMVSSFSCILDAEAIYVIEDFFPYHYRLNEESIMEKADFDFYKKSLAMNNQMRKIIQEKQLQGFEIQLNNDLLSLAFWGMERMIKSDAKREQKKKYIRQILEDSSFVKALKQENLTRGNRKCYVYALLSKAKFINILYFFISKIVLKKREMFGY